MELYKEGILSSNNIEAGNELPTKEIPTGDLVRNDDERVPDYVKRLDNESDIEYEERQAFYRKEEKFYNDNKMPETYGDNIPFEDFPTLAAFSLLEGRKVSIKNPDGSSDDGWEVVNTLSRFDSDGGGAVVLRKNGEIKELSFRTKEQSSRSRLI